MLLQRSSGRVSQDYQDHKVGMLCSLLCKSVDWFLNEENIGRYWVKNETRLVSWILEKVIVKLPP